VKCGEAFTKIIGRLGELLPFHGMFSIVYYSLYLFYSNFVFLFSFLAPKFWNIFLEGMKDEHVLVQVSALVNLAAMARLLGYALQDVMVDLFACLQSILTNPRAPALILRGMMS
jgi:hypothetical protein